MVRAVNLYVVNRNPHSPEELHGTFNPRFWPAIPTPTTLRKDDNHPALINHSDHLPHNSRFRHIFTGRNDPDAIHKNPRQGFMKLVACHLTGSGFMINSSFDHNRIQVICLDSSAKQRVTCTPTDLL